MLLYLGLGTLVDGELVVFDDEARPNLGRLLRRHGLTDPWRIRQAEQWFKQWVKTGNCPSLFEQLVSFYEEGCEPRRLIQLRRCLSRVQQNRCDWERFHRAAGVEESDGTFTVTGSGDIVPGADGPTIGFTLLGTLAMLEFPAAGLLKRSKSTVNMRLTISGGPT